VCKTVTLLALMFAATTASADSPGATPTVDRPMTVQLRPPKRESTATVLTLAGIAAPFVLAYPTYERSTDNPMYAPLGGITGLVLPAMGHWYAGRSAYDTSQSQAVHFTIVGLRAWSKARV
jgi:hypothetical protein